ncbi:putative pab-dependent polyspecific ribonuclease subunit pan3 [Phaeomoniella chlamydospora]|uniref:PAN2-PAN3 deadenylation complex subunit PAN3 n=1 Tax=Phaeomoniella chlamydospora TaxID=158046 RepID=A0A0G2GB52_PHACM|nr:putative pab-dependent polyspecific ribonuclease subunit pan3 [Phaeomoniella chlamydospora]
MAATTSKSNVDDARRAAALSPKVKGRENAKDTLCRNVTIYGKCRYEDKGMHASSRNLRKGLNVDSPSFTPSLLSVNGANSGKKSTTISPKAASAAVFMPKSIASRSSTPVARQENAANDWSVADVPDFVPQTFESVEMTQHNPLQGPNNSFDPFLSNNNPLNPSANLSQQLHQTTFHDAAQLQSGTFYQSQNAFQQPAQYHLYAPIGPHNSNIHGYQRNVHDFFIPNDLREDLQKKSTATLQTLPSSQLPAQIENYHSLVPLDTHNQRSKLAFDFPTYLYKAQSSKDGNYYCLRRISGFRLTDERAIKTVQNWKSLVNANVVAIHDAFTSRIFGDSSLFFVTDYHPLSKTLSEHHFGTSNLFKSRQQNNANIPEQVLWSYAIQIANALKAIHGKGLAARVIDPTRVLLTGKNRVRLNGCAIMDVIRFDQNTTPAELRLRDLQDFGYLLLALGANNPDAAHAPAKAMDQLKRHYAQTSIQTAIHWLCSALHNPDRTIDAFIREIASEAILALNSALHFEDQLTCQLSRELENGRLVRLLAKFGFINERPEYDHDPRWSENGDRYFLKLFRDYVFHQVDSQNNPVVDLGHVLNCLNKLDAGVDEKVTLEDTLNEDLMITEESNVLNCNR